MKNVMTIRSRRKFLESFCGVSSIKLAGSLWSAPIVTSVVLPAHATTSVAQAVCEASSSVLLPEFVFLCGDAPTSIDHSLVEVNGCVEVVSTVVDDTAPFIPLQSVRITGTVDQQTGNIRVVVFPVGFGNTSSCSQNTPSNFNPGFAQVLTDRGNLYEQRGYAVVSEAGTIRVPQIELFPSDGPIIVI